MREFLNLRAHIALGLIFAFLLNSVGPIPKAQAEEFTLPAPGHMVALSQATNPPILKGLKVHPDNPFRFDFILDQGSDSLPPRGEGKGGGYQEQLKQESTKLIKYFLASITIPENDCWVNLSPYEKNRIIPNSFGQTEMGRDLLAEDYMLKQITASLIYPEGEIGKKFWNEVYKQAAKKFGTTNIPVDTFNKVWIVPDKAVVYENTKEGTAYVIKSTLKVMLEEDYLALQKHAKKNLSFPKALVGNLEMAQTLDPRQTTVRVRLEDHKHSGVTSVNSLASEIIREVVIPQLNKEVNQGKNFTQLRQVYNSLILATWYKKKIKDSILAEIYANKNKVVGLRYKSNENNVEVIYHRYLKAFKKGVFNYIKEDPTVFPPPGGEGKGGGRIPRKYFSGGMQITPQINITNTFAMSTLPREAYVVTTNAAMSTEATPEFTNSEKVQENLRKKPVLIIIDDDMFVKGALLIRAVKSKNPNIKILVARSGEEGLAMINAHADELGLIICDYNMPGLNGGGVRRELLANDQYRKIPFVLYSSLPPEDWNGGPSSFLVGGREDYLVWKFIPDAAMKVKAMGKRSGELQGEKIEALRHDSPVSFDFSKYLNQWIILADDKPYILKGYEQILQAQGFKNILTASTTKEAMERINYLRNQGIKSEDIVLISDYQFEGEDTALTLINGLRVPEQGDVFKGPILIVSGSIVSRNEMPGYQEGKLDPDAAKSYGLAYLEKNGKFYFRENLLAELHRMLQDPPNPLDFSRERLSSKHDVASGAQEPMPQQLIYFEGAINDWENASGNALRDVGDHLQQVDLTDQERSKFEAHLAAIVDHIEFGRIPKSRTFESRIHDYKSALHQVLAFDLRALQDDSEKLNNSPATDDFKSTLNQLENVLRASFQNAYFLHQFFNVTRLLSRSKVLDDLLRESVIEYQIRYEGKSNHDWDPNVGIAQAWAEFERLNPDMKRANLEDAIKDWGRLRNDYKSVQEGLAPIIRERMGVRNAGFLEMMSRNLNRFFALYLRQYGLSGLQGFYPGRAVGEIKILRGSEDEIRQSLEGLESGRIVVLDQEYSTLSAAGNEQTGMIFSREGGQHLATRAKTLGIPLVYFSNAVEMLEDGMKVVLISEAGKGSILPATKEEAKSAQVLKKTTRRVEPSPANENAEPLAYLYGNDYEGASREQVIADLGPKGARLMLMYRDQEESSATVPNTLFLTFGFWKALRESNPIKASEIAELQRNIAAEMDNQRSDLVKVRSILEKIRSIIITMQIPEQIRKNILRRRHQEDPEYIKKQPGYKPYIPALIIRATSNVQDLENDAGVGAGVEDSNEVPKTFSEAEYEKLVLETLASFWKWEAFADRRQWGISEDSAPRRLTLM